MKITIVEKKMTLVLFIKKIIKKQFDNIKVILLLMFKIIISKLDN